MDWKDACKKLQKEGLKFEFYCDGSWSSSTWNFTEKIEGYLIAAQPIPDREDWRELCGKLQNLGVEFEGYDDDGLGWISSGLILWSFRWDKEQYRIKAQPIPAGIEKYLEREMTEQKQDKPEIPHLEQQIQWHEDMLRSLRTGEPMLEWEYRLAVGDGEWKICNDPHFSEKYEYRRKPRTVTYWHCVTEYEGMYGLIRSLLISFEGVDRLQKTVDQNKSRNSTTKFSPIIETTVEMED